MREVIAVACTGCESPGKSVYWTTKNKKNDPDRIELKKYCSFCRKHAAHKEKPVSYTHLRAHETVLDLVCRLLLEKKKHIH